MPLNNNFVLVQTVSPEKVVRHYDNQVNETKIMATPIFSNQSIMRAPQMLFFSVKVCFKI